MSMGTGKKDAQGITDSVEGFHGLGLGHMQPRIQQTKGWYLHGLLKAQPPTSHTCLAASQTWQAAPE